MYSGIGAPRTLLVAKSTVCACCRAMRVITLVGSVEASAASVSIEPLAVAVRAAPVAAWIARKRSPIGISPVGTSIRARLNAFAPDCSVRVLTALYSVRSERLFCEQLGYNLLWLWFLDREFSEGSFNHSVFAKNYERVLSADVAKLLFAGVYLIRQ